MNVQMQYPLLSPHQKSATDQLRQAMRSRIYAILQNKVTRRTDDAVWQQKLIHAANLLEDKLRSMAKSEVPNLITLDLPKTIVYRAGHTLLDDVFVQMEYADLGDLEVRLSSIMKDSLRRNSQRPTCPPSNVGMSVSEGISALPDSLITQILLNLPTKDSVKTSVLSKRWRNLWLDVPGLELHSNDFPSLYSDAIKNFTERFLELNRELRLQKFKIKYDESNVYLFGISELIATAVDRGAQYLDVDTLRCPITKDLMPLDIYKSKTLVSLKLVNVGMANSEFIVSIPCLKIMHLENIFCSNDDPLIMEKLISGCSVLEDLTVLRVFGDNVPVLRVRSHTLKRFCVTSSSPVRRISGKDYAIEIDAPGLKYMNFRDGESDRVVAKNLSSLFLIDIDTWFNHGWFTTWGMKKRTIRDFLTEISSVRHMIISQRTLEGLYIKLQLGPISKFHNLSRLEATFCTLLLQMLPEFLESFPNLKHLTLYLVYLKELEPENLELTKMPRCLLSSLECVEIKEVIAGEKIGVKRARNIKRSTTKVAKHKRKIWMKAVKYILENALVLKTLILCFSPETNSVSDISKELLTFTKRSPICEIFIKLAFL